MTMREVIIAAINDNLDCGDCKISKDDTYVVQAVLRAMREPSKRMLVDGEDYLEACPSADCVWRAMIDTALKEAAPNG